MAAPKGLGKGLGALMGDFMEEPAGKSLRGLLMLSYSMTASYWMELTEPSSRMMVRVEVVPLRM